jgi:hypothetical protein
MSLRLFMAFGVDEPSAVDGLRLFIASLLMASLFMAFGVDEPAAVYRFAVDDLLNCLLL